MRFAALPVVGLVVLSGCGGGGTKTVVQTVTAPSTTPATTSTAAAAPRDCHALGIDTQGRKEGTCIDNGVTQRIVNRHTKLILPQLDVKLGGISQEQTLSASTGTKAAHGTYVIVRMTVTNKLHAPTSFDEHQKQVLLLLGSNVYTESFEAENMPGSSFLWNNTNPIQPGETRTGTVTFDVPNNVLADLHKSGNLTVYQFSDADLSQDEKPAKTVGVFRTYQ